MGCNAVVVDCSIAEIVWTCASIGNVGKVARDIIIENEGCPLGRLIVQYEVEIVAENEGKVVPIRVSHIIKEDPGQVVTNSQLEMDITGNRWIAGGLIVGCPNSIEVVDIPKVVEVIRQRINSKEVLLVQCEVIPCELGRHGMSPVWIMGVVVKVDITKPVSTSIVAHPMSKSCPILG